MLGTGWPLLSISVAAASMAPFGPRLAASRCIIRGHVPISDAGAVLAKVRVPASPTCRDFAHRVRERLLETPVEAADARAERQASFVLGGVRHGRNPPSAAVPVIQNQ